ncbi:microcompartment protein CcmL/EutN [Anaerosolibacter carboniphilus]|uniref:Microcompartment protein CcmL/EutN n=1 Tax=Anaerosolibacter carboniphilus TaxID=1417629 RepID=A0A841KW14_9FIRM|nr:BMC domain-containing protein [Anaerosolibacter carboniphilus]MBB6217631.1 microcompartment protein CcmL/EutN [Anaerosolibacter carboniphilus]
MPKLALGMIETVGLAAAMEAADTAVKSANVTLLGYENSKGGGLITIKIEGDVGAVKAAVEAACAAASKINKVFSKQVIPRPHEEIEKLIYTKDTVGITQPMEEDKPEIETEIEVKVEDKEEVEIEEVRAEVEVEEPVMEVLEENTDDDGEEALAFINSSEEVCNLCKDPKCTRRKGDLRSTCIHYDELKEELS